MGECRRRRFAVAGALLVAVLMASAALAAGPDDVVLGSAEFAAPSGDGFGEVEPRRIYNGGVASGLVKKIRWKHWGAPTAVGTGRGHQYKPGGGYYRRTVTVELKARRLGQCPGDPRPAYTMLRARFQEKPGGRFGDWFSWSGAESICEPGFGQSNAKLAPK
jgi:hypothetical protein